MLSVIIPFRDEKESLPILYQDLIGTLGKTGEDFELIFIDDGSEDGGGEAVMKLAEADSNIKFFRNPLAAGKGGALAAGLERSSGDTIIFLDADLQDDPAHIPEFLKLLRSGNDLVNGWRANRTPGPLIRAYGLAFNWLLRIFFLSPFHDENCGYKAFKKSVLGKVNFYPNDFRMFALVVHKAGFKTAELRLTDRPRIYGRSKFGPFKFVGGIRDILLFIFFRRRWWRK